MKKIRNRDKKTQKASKTIQEKPGLKNRKSILVYFVGVQRQESVSDRGKDGDRQTYRQTSKRKETDKTDDQCVSTKLSFENFAKC